MKAPIPSCLQACPDSMGPSTMTAADSASDASFDSRYIFLDKPLLRRALTMRERHERLYKHALLSIALR